MSLTDVNQTTNQQTQTQPPKTGEDLTKPPTTEADKSGALFDKPDPLKEKTEDAKDGDLLSLKKADGTAKTADEVAADKASHEKAETDKAANEAVDLAKFKVPEGIDVKSPIAKEFTDLLNKKDGTPQERTQGLLDLVGKLKEDYDNKSAALWLEQNSQWLAEIDKHYGGEEKAAAAGSRIAKVLDAYNADATEKFKAVDAKTPPPEFGKELRQAMTLTGAGNHPAVAKFLDWVSEQMSEGTVLSGGTPPGQAKSQADKLYGT